MNDDQGEQGVSLIELVLVVLAVGFLALLIANLPSSVASINKSRHTSLARDIANKKIENLREQQFSALLNEENPFTDLTLSKLPSGRATYEVMDCPEEVCGVNLDGKIKQVKAIVFWKEQGEEEKVELTSLIGEGGLGQ